MNEPTSIRKTKPSQTILYKGIVIAIAIVVFGGGLDYLQIFGEEGTLPIVISVCLIAGVLVGITLVSANTGLTIKELVI